MYKQTSRFFRDMNLRSPNDFGPQSKKKVKMPKVYRIRKNLKEQTSRSGTVWVTAEVYNKNKPVDGRLFSPDDREWMMKIPKLDPDRGTRIRNRTGRKVRIRSNSAVGSARFG